MDERTNSNADVEILEDLTEKAPEVISHESEVSVPIEPEIDSEIPDIENSSKEVEPELVNKIEPAAATDEIVSEEEPAAIQIDYQAEIDRLNQERGILVEAAPQLLLHVENQKQETSKLNEWIDRQHTSFLWKVLSRMQSNTDDVYSKLNDFQEYVNSIQVPQSGELQKLRNRFHKGLLIAWLFIFVIAGILLYLPKLAEKISGNNMLVKLVTNQNYPSTSRILFTAGYALVLTLVSLLIQ